MKLPARKRPGPGIWNKPVPRLDDALGAAATAPAVASRLLTGASGDRYPGPPGAWASRLPCHVTGHHRPGPPVRACGRDARAPRRASREAGCAAIPCVAPRRWLRGRRGRAARRVRGGTGPRRSSRGVPGSVGRRSTGWDGAAADRRRHFRCGARWEWAATLPGDGGRRHRSRSALRKAGAGRSSTARCRNCPQGVGPRFRVRSLPWLPARVLRATGSPRTRAAGSRRTSRRAASCPPPNRASGRSAVSRGDAASSKAAVSGRLHLHHPALRRLSLARAAPLHLPRRVQAEVRMARALVGQLAHAEHLRLERRPDRVQQVRERPVARPLPGRAARGVDSPEVGEVRLDRRRQSRARAPHPSSSLLPPSAVWCANPALAASTVARIAAEGHRIRQHFGAHYEAAIEARRTGPTASLRVQVRIQERSQRALL